MELHSKVRMADAKGSDTLLGQDPGEQLGAADKLQDALPQVKDLPLLWLMSICMGNSN